jgi:hypothetical protein
VGLVVGFEACGTYMSAWALVSLVTRSVGATEEGTVPVLTDFAVEGLLRVLRALGGTCRGGVGRAGGRNTL